MKKITEDQLNEILSLKKTLIDIQGSIGGLEVQKNKLYNHHSSISLKMEETAKRYMLLTGIPKENISKFKLNLETGEVVEKD